MKSFPGHVKETGILLNVKNYKKCIRFYSQKLGLRVREQKPYLTIFKFGSSYLLIEKSNKKQGWKNGTLRFNVSNVSQCARALRKRGLNIIFYSTDWGEIGKFYDPEGNQIELCKWK